MAGLETKLDKSPGSNSQPDCKPCELCELANKKLIDSRQYIYHEVNLLIVAFWLNNRMPPHLVLRERRQDLSQENSSLKAIQDHGAQCVVTHTITIHIGAIQELRDYKVFVPGVGDRHIVGQEYVFTLIHLRHLE